MLFMIEDMVMSHGGSAVHLRSGPTRRASGPIRSASRIRSESRDTPRRICCVGYLRSYGNYVNNRHSKSAADTPRLSERIHETDQISLHHELAGLK